MEWCSACMESCRQQQARQLHLQLLLQGSRLEACARQCWYLYSRAGAGASCVAGVNHLTPLPPVLVDWVNCGTRLAGNSDPIVFPHHIKSCKHGKGTRPSSLTQAASFVMSCSAAATRRRAASASP